MAYADLSPEDQARVDTVSNLTIGIVRLIGDMLELHGEDKRILEMVNAGIFGAIDNINKVDDRLVPLLVAMMMNSHDVSKEMGMDASHMNKRKYKYDA